MKTFPNGYQPKPLSEGTPNPPKPPIGGSGASNCRSRTMLQSGVLVSFHVATAEYHLPLGFGHDLTEEIKPGEHVFLFCLWLGDKKCSYDSQGEIHGGMHAEPSRICTEIENILVRFGVRSIHELIGMKAIAEKVDDNRWMLKGPKQ